MMAKRYGNKHHSSNKTFNPRRERRQASTAPQFEVTGIHVVTFVVALLDIVSALERLDLAERRQLIYVGARREEAEQVIEEAEVRADALRAEVAEAERRRDAAVAEANRRLAERHATNTVAGG